MADHPYFARGHGPLAHPWTALKIKPGAVVTACWSRSTELLYTGSGYYLDGWLSRPV